MRPRLVILAALTLCLGAPAAAQTPPAAAPMAVKMVKPGLFMVTGGGGNTSVRVTSEGLAIVDTKNNGQAFFDELMGRIASVSGQKVRYVIDTHHHADHTGNNARFLAAGATVIGQKNLPLELDKFVAPPTAPSATAPARPNMTYDTAYTVKLGGKTVRLMHYAPAHTRGDTLVWFPDLKVVAMGDELVMGRSPNIDYPGGGSVAGWLRSIDALMKLDWDTAIPGHGDDPVSREQVKAFRGKLQTLLDRARAQVKAGTPKDGLIAGIRFDDLWAFPPGFWNEARTNGLWAEAGGR